MFNTTTAFFKKKETEIGKDERNKLSNVTKLKRNFSFLTLLFRG